MSFGFANRSVVGFVAIRAFVVVYLRFRTGCVRRGLLYVIMFDFYTAERYVAVVAL